MNWMKDDIVVDRVLAAVAAGTTDQTSAAIDCLGFDEVTVMAAFGTLTATQVTSIKLQQSDDDGVADAYSDIEGSGSAALDDADSGKMLLATIRPVKRYLKCVIDRGTANAVIDGIWAFKRKARGIPVTQSADVVGWETHDLPAEGTA